RRSDARVIAVRPRSIELGTVQLGESICHDGVCLTVTDVGREAFTVLAGAETLARTTLGDVRIGSKLNLQRALVAGAPLGGHLVAGHVDGLGRIPTPPPRRAH